MCLSLFDHVEVGDINCLSFGDIVVNDLNYSGWDFGEFGIMRRGNACECPILMKLQGSSLCNKTVLR